MKRLLHGSSEILQPANQFKMVRQWIKLQETQSPLDVAQHCSGPELEPRPFKVYQCAKNGLL